MSEARWSFWIFLLTLPCRLLCRFTATAAFSGLKLPLSVLVCSTKSVNRLWTYSIWGDSHTALKMSRINANFHFWQYWLFMNFHLWTSYNTVCVIVQITAYAVSDTFLILWSICVKNKMLLNLYAPSLLDMKLKANIMLSNITFQPAKIMYVLKGCCNIVMQLHAENKRGK